MDQTKCQEIEPLLDGLFDGELTADEEQLTQAHVGQCAECQSKLAEIEAVSKHLAGLPKLSVGRDLSAEILHKARVKVTKSKVVIFRRKEVWAVAAACLLIGLTLQFLQHQPTLQTTPQAPAVSQVSPEKTETPDMRKMDTVRTVAAVPVLPAKNNVIAGAEKPEAKKYSGTLPSKQLLGKSLQDKSLIASSAIGADEVAVDFGYQPNLMEGMGLATDEDGLYALKM